MEHELAQIHASLGPQTAESGDVRLSPVIAVDYLVEGSSVRFDNRPQRPIGGVPESDHVGARVIRRHSDDTSARFLVSNGRMTTPDAQVRGGQHH